MKYPYFTLSFISLFLYYFSGGVSATNIEIGIVGGEVHMNGKLTEGACSVSAGSQDMHIDMGQYTTHSFERVGGLSKTGIPFTLRLTDCKSEISESAGITFSGMTDPKEPDAFLVSSAQGGPVGVSGGAGYSGLGLMISDEQGHQLIPGIAPVAFHQIKDSEVALHYLARYRASSRNIYPGPLRSEVWFDIAYP